MMNFMDKNRLLEAVNLSHSYKTKHGVVQALQTVSIHIKPAETLGIAGESGSGKSTLLRLLSGQETPQQGSVKFEGKEIWPSSPKRRKAYFKKIGIVFQQPRLSFDPRWTIRQSLEEPLKIHGIGASKKKRREMVFDTAHKVGIDPDLLEMPPDRLSGGQLQRAAIARAIIKKPKLVFLDEPTAALDVSVQAQILNLLKKLQEQEGLAYVFVSHDIAVLAFIAHRLMILKKGRIMEEGEAKRILFSPQDDYTKTLLSSVLD